MQLAQHTTKQLFNPPHYGPRRWSMTGKLIVAMIITAFSRQAYCCRYYSYEPAHW
jgi:hypothetical protein